MLLLFLYNICFLSFFLKIFLALGYKNRRPPRCMLPQPPPYHFCLLLFILVYFRLFLLIDQCFFFRSTTGFFRGSISKPSGPWILHSAMSPSWMWKALGVPVERISPAYQPWMLL